MTAAGRPQGQARHGLSIGAVLAQLRTEFPDVTISKIRFLESEGLVRPGRTPSGYRQFSPADVERLRFVLATQRDHYLPLKVIKEQLDAADRGAESPAAAVKPPRRFVAVGSGDGENGGTGGNGTDGTDDPHAAGMPSAADFATGRELRKTQEELLTEAGIDAALLGELEQYGLIRTGAAGFYDADAVRIATTVKAMTEFGIEPRHLRAFRVSADREVGLVEQIAAPVYRHHDTDSAARGDELVRELAALSVTLHTLLVKAGIRAVTGT